MERKSLPVVLLLIAVILAGCGSEKEAAVEDVTPAAAAVGFTRCFNCHQDAQNPTWLSEPFGDTAVVNGWVDSGHFNSNETPGYPPDASCQPCHNPTGDGGLIENYVAATGDEVFGPRNRNLIGCEGCHGASPDHPGGPLGNDLEGDGEFGVCTGCHQLATPLHTDDAALDDRVITDTHVDNGTTNDIEGYVINPAAQHSDLAGNFNSGTCIDCHDPHFADLAINRAWVNSGHAGFIGVNGVPVKDNPPINNPWAHYAFSTQSGGTCNRCHTSTGFRTLANTPTNYIPPTAGAFTSVTELLYCWACHYDHNGGLRNPNTFVLPSTDYVYPSGRSIPASGIGASYICVNCHSGRETGQAIVNTSSTVAGSNFGSFNSHYLAAAGITFRTIGYEYTGRDYTTPAFQHDTIGTATGPAALGTTSGPCAGCHMKTSDSHRFNPVTRDAGTHEITAIKNQTTVCSVCHGGAMTAAVLNTLEEEFEASLDELQSRLQIKNGICYSETAYPYFFVYNTTTGGCVSTDPKFTAWSKDLLGAAFNFNLLKKMGMAFVHNSKYARYLIYDSIDFVDNGAQDNTVQATVITNSAALGFLNGLSGRP